MPDNFGVNAKKLAAMAVFASLTIVLNLSQIKIPAPYAPYLIYQIWEVPIVTAYLLYGFLIGFPIAILNTFVLLIVYPGMLPTGPLYNLAAVVSTLVGIAITKIFRKNPQNSMATATVMLTAFGIIFRVVLMTVVNWTFLRFPPPVGYAMPEEAIILALPLIAFFNATLALYTIPLSYIIAETIKRHVKI